MSKLKMSFTEAVKRDAIAATEAYPEVLGNLLVINSRMPIHAGSKTMKVLKDAAIEGGEVGLDGHYRIKGVVKKFNKHMVEKSKACMLKRDFELGSKKSERVNIIAVNEGVLLRGYSNEYTKAMTLEDTYNSRIAQLIFTEYNDSINKDNLNIYASAVIAYMALRHKQAHGRDTKFSKHNNYSHEVVLGGNSANYNDVIIQKIEDLSRYKKVDLSKLSFKDTVKLAADIAVKYSVKPEVLSEISKAYKPLVAMYENNGKEYNAEMARECFEIMREHKGDKDIYVTGLRFLKKTQFDKVKAIDEQIIKVNKKKVVKSYKSQIFTLKERQEMEDYIPRTEGFSVDLSVNADKDLGKKAMKVDALIKFIKKSSKSQSEKGLLGGLKSLLH